MKKFTLMLLMVFALGVTSVMAQGRTISGKVLDASTKQPIVGATIIVQGSQNGGYSLDGGAFTISNVNGAVNLEVTFMGYKEGIVPVAASATNVEVLLTPSAMQLDEIVVVAYGKADKKSLTGSVAVVSSDKIESRTMTSVTSAIAGSAPGIQMTTASGAPGSEPTMRIRGIGSINSSSAPLYVVDGTPYSGSISNLSSDDIASLSILKDAASTALYGSKAANGVVMIQTKTGRKDKVTFNVKINQGVMFRAQPEYDKVNAQEFYQLGWETYRNDLYFASGQSLADANTNASITIPGTGTNQNVVDGNKWYNIMKDSKTGVQIPNNSLLAPSGSDWATGVLNPNAVMMDGYASDLDWMSAVAGVGYRQNYNISASGGSDKATYFGSVGYTNEDSFFKNTNFERLTGRLKTDVRPTKWLKFGENISITYAKSNNPYGSGSSTYSNPWFTARTMAPIYPVHAHDAATGNYFTDPQGDYIYDNGEATTYGEYSKATRGQSLGRHVLWEGDLNKAETTRLNFMGQIYAEITFLKDFKFTIDGSMHNDYNWVSSYTNNIIGDASPAGRLSNSSNRDQDYTFKQMLEWERQFGEHNVSVLLGHENFQAKRNYLYGYKNSMNVIGIIELDNFATMSDITGYSSMYRSEGYFARANYNYDEKYYVSASFRRDGSSKFNPNNRWGNFWSIGATWILSSENFMQNATWVDFLKLRVSYGTNGNDDGFYDGRYIWQTLYGVSSYNDDKMLYWSTDGAPDLTWETQGALDLGVNFRFWNRLNGDITFFNKVSDELIFSRPLPYESGSTSIKQNIGSMYNRGLEFAFDVDAIRSKDWLWNIGINATWYKNRITNLPPETMDNIHNPADNGIISGSKKYLPGKSIYAYWMRQFSHIDVQDGSSVYLYDDGLTKEGDKKYAWDPSTDKSQFEKDGVKYTKKSGQALYDYSGDAIPALYGAVNTSLTWKNLSLSILFTYKIGGKAIDNSYNGLMSADLNGAMHKNILNSWRKPGDVTNLPRLQSTDTNLNAQSTRHLVSASYLALQNVTLSYNFPKKIANKLTLSALSVYASAENLFQVSAMKGFDAASTFTGVQDNSRFGSMAVVSFGVNVSF